MWVDPENKNDLIFILTPNRPAGRKTELSPEYGEQPASISRTGANKIPGSRKGGRKHDQRPGRQGLLGLWAIRLLVPREKGYGPAVDEIDLLVSPIRSAGDVPRPRMGHNVMDLRRHTSGSLLRTIHRCSSRIQCRKYPSTQLRHFWLKNYSRRFWKIFSLVTDNFRLTIHNCTKMVT